MTSQKRKQINSIAEQIRGAIGYTTGTPIENIISQLGGTVEFYPGLMEDGNPVDAKIEKIENSFKITINNQSESRKNFSIAHELGHLFLHMGYLINPGLWNTTTQYADSVYLRYGYSEEEYEANEFAAAFLMPENEFRQYVRMNLNHRSVDIEKVAEHFMVSTQAAETRGKWLGIFSWD